MDESLPSSLSEHPTDSQHQAIVSLLQVCVATMMMTMRAGLLGESLGELVGWVWGTGRVSLIES